MKPSRLLNLLLLLAFLLLPPLAVAEVPAGPPRLSAIRFWSNPGSTRVAIELGATAAYTFNQLPAEPATGQPPRLYLDLGPAALDPALQAPIAVGDGLLKRIRTGRADGGRIRVVLDLESVGPYKVFPLFDPYRIIVDLGAAGSPTTESPAQAPPAAPAAALPSPPAAPADDVARVLERQPPSLPPVLPKAPPPTGLRRIVVDAGHGGKDPGAVGQNGLREKDVTLAMAKKIAGRLREELGCEVILTRDRDIYLALQERTAIANRVNADLFLSVHANAAPNRQAYGIETYYLNFSKNDKAAAVAARENGISLKEVGDLEMILLDLMANAKINESSRLAAEIQRALIVRLSGEFDEIRDLGVRQGPFYVLLGASMPSVLVEVAFISHHREEQRLADERYHEHTAAAIVEGVQNYARSSRAVAVSP